MRFADKVVYQIYPKSFYDTNGDGFGDLAGVTAKIPYLQELGVDYLWLTPFFISPQKDNGYDVTNYYAIDERFGTMADFEHLVAEAKQRGIGLMLDMVFNHTSSASAWFQKALAGDERYQNYYIFREGKSDQPPTNWVSKFGGSAWEYVPSLKKWYLHLFDISQPDLNWENPQVREELKKVIHFWQGKGVEGFRFDVVNLISKPEEFEDDLEGDGRRFYTDGRHVHDFLKELVRDTELQTFITVGEMSSTSIENCILYSNPQEKELTMTFSFHHLKVDYKNGNKWALQKPDFMALKNLFQTWQEGMEAGGGWNALFWCNHDQPRIVSRFGDEGKYWAKSAKMLAAAIHFMRGTPYIYQGEELGMKNAHFTSIDQYRDVESLNNYRILLEQGHGKEEALHIIAERSRDNGRTPMAWDASAHAGFTTGEPWISVPKDYQQVNAAAELQDPNSIFHFYQKLIQLRKQYPIIAEGTIHFLEKENAQVLAYERTLGEAHMLVYCNLTDQEAQVTKSLDTYLQAGYQKFLGNDDGLQASLRPFEFVVLYRKK